MMSAPVYQDGVLAHAKGGERERLRLLEELSDPTTITIFERLGVAAGWHCVEAGAGAGSIAHWLSARCPDGRVTATDLDVAFLNERATPANMTVTRHDVMRDDFPAGTQNLVHARALLSHIPDPERVLERMADWLVPGGWIVLEDPTYLPAAASPYPQFAELLEACQQLLARTQGTDHTWARRIPAAMARAGLTDIGMTVRVAVCGTDETEDAFWRQCFTQATPALIETGLMTAEQIAAAVAHLDDPAFTDTAWVMVSCWGRRPS
ncbi:trans-aconitate 2-methyltransferase [Streptomyces sp. FH025]|uniref:class I SAM-dependent methyltransferase n=1 Tax=Streptomyces sp. FH025 TaxID=2815937 RepID=UPI001A9F90D8|nr:class I SAM-dependent methyltransferase [Streptomyces sp. FH025]MBO1413750.1 class I SAM-dependent methyltransferase [Streptomyces sp. FH025]